MKDGKTPWCWKYDAHEFCTDPACVCECHDDGGAGVRGPRAPYPAPPREESEALPCPT